MAVAAAHAPLSQVIFPLGTPAGYPVSVPTWFKVSPTADMRAKAPTGKSQVLGEIQVTVEFTPSASSLSAQIKPVPFELEEVQRPRLVVNVLQARNLPACDSNGKSDPYLVRGPEPRCAADRDAQILTVNKERYKTKPRFKTLCPVFDAEFVFGESRLIQGACSSRRAPGPTRRRVRHSQAVVPGFRPGSRNHVRRPHRRAGSAAVRRPQAARRAQVVRARALCRAADASAVNNRYTLTSGDFPVAGEVRARLLATGLTRA